MAFAWHLLGDKYQSRRSETASAFDDDRSRQRPEEVEAYRKADALYQTAHGEFDSERPQRLLLKCGLFRIQCLTALGAWQRALDASDAFHTQLKKLVAAEVVADKLADQLKAETFLGAVNLKRLVGDYEGSRQRTHDARRIFARLRDNTGQVRSHINLAAIYLQEGDADKADQMLKEALGFPESVAFRSRIQALRTVAEEGGFSLRERWQAHERV